MPDENQLQGVSATPTPREGEQVGLRVSLIPAEEAERQDPRQGFRHFLTAVIVSVIILGGITGGLWFWVNANQQKVSQLDAATADYAKQSKDMAPLIKDAQNTQARLSALATLLPEHKTGLKILTFLENNTLPSVGYSSISVGDDGTVNLMASAATFEAYAAQIDELRSQSEVTNVAASSLTPTYDDKNNLQKVDFNLSITFNPSIFVNN
jgi:outer membrane murein-binding lipoprotein Lpp